MLGRLARWLRLLGFDTLYDAGWSDHQIAARARGEDRVVLTRDRELARRRGIRVLLLESQVLEEQLAQILETLGISLPGGASRCPRCNAQLSPASRQEASRCVPAFVLDRHEHFSYCAHCDKMYWQGSHWQNVHEIAAELRRQAE